MYGVEETIIFMKGRDFLREAVDFYISEKSPRTVPEDFFEMGKKKNLMKLFKKVTKKQQQERVIAKKPDKRLCGYWSLIREKVEVEAEYLEFGLEEMLTVDSIAPEIMKKIIEKGVMHATEVKFVHGIKALEKYQVNPNRVLHPKSYFAADVINVGKGKIIVNYGILY